jgi:hypothetical protein
MQWTSWIAGPCKLLHLQDCLHSHLSQLPI